MEIFNFFKNKQQEKQVVEGETGSSLEANLIRNINELSLSIVKEVMIPRIDVVFINYEKEREEILDIITSSNHSRFPVYESNVDNVIGILHTKDILYHMHKKDFYSINLHEIMRKAVFVPETKRLDSLLREFQESHNHIAIVVDEYGGVSGIVTLEDILEEIVGDIQDEFDNERDKILDLGDGNYLCDARILIEELNEYLNISLPNDDFDTLGGFVYDLFGRVPLRNERVTYGNLDFIIHNIKQRNIKSIKVHKRENMRDENLEQN